MGTNGESKSWRFRLLVAFIFVVVIVLWLWLPRIFSDDVYAGVNALFSGLAFGGLIVAILYQSQELQLQRRELKDTRQVMQDQKEQIEGQKQQMEIQNFENRFFQMMRTWNELRDKIHGGDALFESMVGEVSGEYLKHLRSDPQEGDVAALDSAVGLVWKRHQRSLPVYMRSLYQILKLVRQTALPYEEQKFYSNVVRAQMTQAETVLVVYNCLSSIGSKLKENVEYYSLLKYLDSREHVSAAQRDRFDPHAFV